MANTTRQYTKSELYRHIKPYTGCNAIWVAYSGGLDSHVLLHSLCQLKSQVLVSIKAVYIDHGLHPDAKSWGQHCQHVCDELEVELHSIEVTVNDDKGTSLEGEARIARYRAFEELLGCHEIILTAHHQSDQAETILLQMLRGAGPLGLASMPIDSSLGQGRLIRPLINYSRKQLERYANDKNLKWIEDSSNQDDRFKRNFLRNNIIPALRQQWPECEKTLSRSAAHCADLSTFSMGYAKKALQSVKKVDANTINIQKLQTYDQLHQKNMLRVWIKNSGALLPSTKVLNEIIKGVVLAREDATPCVSWGHNEIRRYKGHIYLRKKEPDFILSERLVWDTMKTLVLPDGRSIKLVEEVTDTGLDAMLCQTGHVTVRFRSGGERIRLANRKGKHSLKKLFQEALIPPWERTRLPLIYINGQLAAVADLWVSSEFIVESKNNKHASRVVYG